MINEINDRIVEMRGRCLSTIKAEITDRVFGESEIVYMATEDFMNWYNREFVFVIPANVSSTIAIRARNFWAETKMFDKPVEVKD